MEIALQFAIALVAGLCVGVLSALLGIGGGAIMVPLFRLVFSLEPIAATATSLFCILPTSLTGTVAHARNGTSVPRLGLAMGVGGALLSPVGVLLASRSPDVLVMAVAAVIIIYSAVSMVRKALALPKDGNEAQGKESVREGCRADAESCVRADAGADCASAVSDGPEAAPAPAPAAADARASKPLGPKRLLQSAAIGAVAGLCSGYVGVGGGFIMVPLMLSVLNMPMRLASGTSLTAVAILAVPGIVTQALLGNIDYLVGIAVICGSIPGAAAGARLVKRIPERRLRLLFAAILGLAAIALVVNELL